MAVKFLVPTQVGSLYNKDDVAGFSEEVEKQLIDAKVAKAVSAKDAAPASGDKKPA